MELKIQHCPVCDGITYHWNKCTQEWTALYADGGVYCDCPDDELASGKKESRAYQI